MPQAYRLFRLTVDICFLTICQYHSCTTIQAYFVTYRHSCYILFFQTIIYNRKHFLTTAINKKCIYLLCTYVKGIDSMSRLDSLGIDAIHISTFFFSIFCITLNVSFVNCTYTCIHITSLCVPWLFIDYVFVFCRTLMWKMNSNWCVTFCNYYLYCGYNAYQSLL